jgi:hypothetical protein
LRVNPFLRRTLAFLLAGIIGFGSSLPAAAAKKATRPEGGRIAGKIFAADGATPVAGGVVKALPLLGGEARQAPPADAKGEFVLEGLAYGYYDIVVEGASGTFIANQVVSVPPNGRVELRFALTAYADKSPAWWAGRETRSVPGITATGSAELKQRARGAAFWRSPGGIAVITGIGAVALLAIASGGGGSSSTTNP